MKLYKLTPKDNLPSAVNPWEPWYDKVFGFVVRAENGEQARHIADANSGDENRFALHPWLDPAFSDCIELLADGPAEMILQDYHSA